MHQLLRSKSKFPNHFAFTLGRYLFMLFLSTLLALFVGQRLCINFVVSRVNFLTTLHSHLNVTCSYYIWYSLFNVDVNYGYIYI